MSRGVVTRTACPRDSRLVKRRSYASHSDGPRSSLQVNDVQATFGGSADSIVTSTTKMGPNPATFDTNRCAS